MLVVWKQMLPLIKARHWNGPGNSTHFLFSEIFFRPCQYLLNLGNRQLFMHEFYLRELEAPVKEAPEIFARLAALDFGIEDAFIWRDVLDLARTCAARTLHYGLLKMIFAFESWRNFKGQGQEVLERLELCGKMLDLLGQILAAHPDYSMYESLLLLQKHPQCNPDFEKTLKGNAENGYCRAYIYELVGDIYRPEFALAADIIRQQMAQNNHEQLLNPEELVKDDLKKIADAFYQKPLQKMAPDIKKALQKLPANLRKISQLSKKLIA